jgi:hypothetical protein
MRRFTKKQYLVAGVAAAIIAGTAGSAIAYWTTSGSGSGNANTASANGTIVLHATFAAGLTPGAHEAVAYTADNGGSSSLLVGTITPTVSIDSGHSTCLATDFTIAPTTSNTTVPKNSTAVSVGAGDLAFADTAVNQDGCKGATVTLTLSSN